jgi:hypothetical protein
MVQKIEQPCLSTFMGVWLGRPNQQQNWENVQMMTKSYSPQQEAGIPDIQLKKVNSWSKLGDPCVAGFVVNRKG